MPAITSRAPPSSNSEPKAASALPKVSSPESVCIGAHEPPFGVPSIRKRAPSRAIMRCQVSGFSSAIVRATSPPIEWATMRTGCWLAVARRRARRRPRSAEAARLVLDRPAPVVGERDHLVAVGEALDQVAVDAADRPVGLDARRGRRVPGERLQAVDEAKAEPDALAVLLQVASRGCPGRTNTAGRSAAPAAAPSARRASARPRARRACRSRPRRPTRAGRSPRSRPARRRAARS